MKTMRFYQELISTNNKLAHKDSEFSLGISNWYKKNGRENLPWREDITPYRIWISEVMLQQTQVKTVIPFFNSFIRNYPDLNKLSSASEENVLALWTGLGFYRRAKNIFKAKEVIKANFDNQFPTKFDEIISLPGIGDSTAGAIMSIAYKEPYPILDANVKRVISRYEGIANDSSTSSIKELWTLSKKHTPLKNIFEYTQGIMDIGATICNTKTPECKICPLHSSCQSAFSTIEKKAISKKINPIKYIHFELAYTDKKVLLFKRHKKTFWESLWIPYEADDDRSSLIDKKEIESQIINIKHKLSHLDLDITVKLIKYKNIFNLTTNLEYLWIKKDEIEKFGLPKPIKTIIEGI